MIAPGNPITAADMAALAGLANSKSSLQSVSGSHWPYSFPDWSGIGPNPKWLTTLNNLRADLNAVITQILGETQNGTAIIPIYPWIYNSISGSPATPYKVAGWPLGGPSSTGPSINNLYLKFWYEDNGQPQYVFATQAGGLGTGQGVTSLGKFTTTIRTTNLSFSGLGGSPSYNNRNPCAVDLTPTPHVVQGQEAWIKTQTFEFEIGGDLDVTIQGDFWIALQVSQGATVTLSPIVYGPDFHPEYDLVETVTLDSGPPPKPTVDGGNWFSGADTEVIAPPSFDSPGWPTNPLYVYVVSRVNGTFSPGKYTMTITVPVSNDTAELSSFELDGAPIYYASTSFYPSRVGFQSGGQLNSPGFFQAQTLNSVNPPTSFGTYSYASITTERLGPGVLAPGIDRQAPVLMIDCLPLYEPNSKPFALYSLIYQPVDTSWLAAPFPQPAFRDPWYFALGQTVNASCTGFWTGMSAPIANVNALRPANMPWNVGIPGIGNEMLSANSAVQTNSYDQTKTVEAQAEPPLWQAGRVFTQFFVIQDSVGNLQQCTVSGTSGGAAPAWGTKVGAVVKDGTAQWTCIKVLKRPRSIAPAVHFPINSASGPSSVAIWPYYWFSETEQDLIPPPFSAANPTQWGWHDQWLYFQTGGGPSTPVGWYVTNNVALNGPAINRGSGLGAWIYTITLNRVSQKVKGIPLPTKNQIPVQIGFTRNGVFISLGSFQTGQTYQVLWPVFTSEPLVYKASERIDMQAMAIQPGGVNAGGLASVPNYPQAAAYVADVMALLNFIS